MQLNDKIKKENKTNKNIKVNDREGSAQNKIFILEVFELNNFMFS